MRRLWLACAAVAAALLLLPVLLAFGLWVRVAPAPGHQTVRLPLPVIGAVEVSAAKLLHAATDPRLARWLDGRRVASPLGELALRWHAQSATLLARCAPCVLQVAAFGDTPLVLAEAKLELRRDGEARYGGRLASGEVELPFSAEVTPATFALRGELAPTPLHALFALFGGAVPEAQHARIDGTLAARVALRWPQRRLRIEPVIDGFAVHGLGTEALAHARAPRQCEPLRRVSLWLERAVIAAEDQRFAEHAGYDLTELRAAIEGNQQVGRAARGASTITQQLARLVYTGDERSLARKARELLYAVEMERTLGKGRILRLYLAMAPWGDGVCGAEGAARRYFGKGAASLNGAEAAWLAVRLRAPDRYTPVPSTIRTSRTAPSPSATSAAW